MKIALISPKAPFLSSNPEFQSFFTQSPQMEFYWQYWSGLGSGLLVLGALTPDDVKVELFDENIEHIDFSGDYDLVAISMMTQQASRGYDIARKFRERKSKVVLGGIHPTVLPEEAKQYADSIVVGEAENVWEELLNDFHHNRLRPVYTSHQEVDLRKSPTPRYELLENKSYKMVWVQATRGCPHDCKFCCASRVYGNKYRHKSTAQVIEEIKKINKIERHALIGFADDNLFCDRKYSQELLKQVSNLKIRWIGQSDIRISNDKHLLKHIKKSGCVALLIGLESLCEENLRGLDSSDWKLKQSKNYAESIQIIQSIGIGVIGTFIVGFDHDESTVFDELAEFIIDNRLVGAQIAALTPFPRTKIREQFLEEGKIMDTPWSNYTLYNVNIKPKRMNVQELERGILYTFKRVYSEKVAREKTKYFKNIFSQLVK